MAFSTGLPQQITWAAWPSPSSSPGFPLAVDKQVVKEEEGSLLDVAGGDLQQSALQEELGADVREVRALGMEGRNEQQEHTCFRSFPAAQDKSYSREKGLISAP